jgi:hypothetical protein
MLDIVHCLRCEGSSNINWTFFLKYRDSHIKQNCFMVVREGILITIIMCPCMSACFLSVAIMISVLVVPSAVAQHITIKFLTNENMKPTEILT